MRKLGLILFVTLLITGCATHKTGQSDGLLSALQQGGYVIFFRHAATDHTQKDTDLNDPTNCAAQRHLDERGREQSRIIGEGFKINKIPVGDVVTSQFCRCSNTAKIAFGKAQTSIDITSIQGVTPEERQRRIAGIREMLNTPPRPGTNTVLVAHKWMFKDASGVLLEEGEAAIFKPQSEGMALLVRRVLPEQWKTLAQIAETP
jgi:broad specificity phosphatase PhoE